MDISALKEDFPSDAESMNAKEFVLSWKLPRELNVHPCVSPAVKCYP